MRIIYDINKNVCVLRDDGSIVFNNNTLGVYNIDTKALVCGRVDRIKEVTNEKPFKLPIVACEIADIDYLVVATEKEALKTNWEGLVNSQRDNINFLIKREQFTYAKIKGINC